MQYSSFIGDHIPCRFKSLIEDSSLRQLHFSSEDRHKIKPEFIAEFRNKATCTAKSKNSATSDNASKGNGKKRKGNEEESGGKPLSLKEVFLLINKGGRFTRAFRGWKICPLVHNKPVLYGLPDDPKARTRRSNSLYLSSYDVDFPQFISRSARYMNLQSGITGNSSNTASSFSTKSSAGSLLLSPSQIVTRSASKVRSCHGSASLNLSSGASANLNSRSGTSTSTGHSASNSVADKTTVTSRQRFVVSQTVRPASSCLIMAKEERRNETLRPVASLSEQSSAADEPLDVDFTFEDNVDKESFVTGYREGYTYRKLREQQSRSSSSTRSTLSSTALSTPPTQPHTPTQVTNCRTRLVSCVTGTSATNISKSATVAKRPTVSARSREANRTNHSNSGLQRPPKTAPGCDADFDEKNSVPWQRNQQFHDICDPSRLTVNKPSPTEVAVLCRIPQMMHKSSPSIPSNTNGKYGGKVSDKPYPFQLNISAASVPVQAAAKKATKSLFDFI